VSWSLLDSSQNRLEFVLVGKKENMQMNVTVLAPNTGDKRMAAASQGH
jgi:hypothetical protein